MKMTKVKRAVAGGYIKADMSPMANGTEIVVGRITKIDPDKGRVHFKPADGGAQTWCARDEIFKATKQEFEEAEKAAKEEKKASKAAAKPEVKKAAAKVSKALADAEDDEEDEEGRVRIRPDLDNYVVGGEDGKTVTISGRKTVDTGDVVADAFRAKTVEEVYAMAAHYLYNMHVTVVGKRGSEVAATVAGLKSKYEHLNIGMQRMNLGNLVRNNMQRLDLDELPERPVKIA